MLLQQKCLQGLYCSPQVTNATRPQPAENTAASAAPRRREGCFVFNCHSWFWGEECFLTLSFLGDISRTVCTRTSRQSGRLLWKGQLHSTTLSSSEKEKEQEPRGEAELGARPSSPHPGLRVPSHRWPLPFPLISHMLLWPSKTLVTEVPLSPFPHYPLPHNRPLLSKSRASSKHPSVKPCWRLTPLNNWG